MYKALGRHYWRQAYHYTRDELPRLSTTNDSEFVLRQPSPTWMVAETKRHDTYTDMYYNYEAN